MKKRVAKAPRTIHPDDAAFGAQVKTVREAGEPRLTQTWMARELGVTNTQVQKYESGVNRVTISRGFEIADALGVPLSDLIKKVEGQRRR